VPALPMAAERAVMALASSRVDLPDPFSLAKKVTGAVKLSS